MIRKTRYLLLGAFLIFLAGVVFLWKAADTPNVSNSPDVDSTIQNSEELTPSSTSQQLDEIVAVSDAIEIVDAREILVCNDNTEPADSPSFDLAIVMEDAQDFYLELIQPLAKSADVEQQVMAELLSRAPDSDTQIANLNSLSNDFPRNQLAALHLLTACIENFEHPACNNAVVDRVVSLDGDNSIAWATVAGFEMQRGNLQGAKTALQNAAAAPTFDDYFRRHLNLIREHLPVSSPEAKITVYGRAIGVGVAVNPSRQILTTVPKMCDDHAAADAELASACLTFGQRMQKQSSNILNMRLGAVLRETTFLALGDAESAVKITEELAALMEPISDTAARLATNLMNHDDNLAVNWFAQMVANGETAAQDYLVEEAKNLSANPDYNPCR